MIASSSALVLACLLLAIYDFATFRSTMLANRTVQAAIVGSNSISALTFDVFGTVVDWRTSITREGEAFGTPRRLSVDWAKFADAWRGLAGYRSRHRQCRRR